MVSIPFLGRKEHAEEVGRGMVPVDRVKELAGKGFSEPEIIDVLRREGFSADECDKALTQVLKLGVAAPTPSSSQTQPTPTEQPILPTLEQIQPNQTQEVQQQEIPETSLPQEYYQNYSPEVYVDYVIQERVGELQKKMGEFSSKYSEVQKKIEEISKQLDQLSRGKGVDQKEVIGKIDGFGENITDINARLSSLEKAFKETLPTLIESVRVLSDVVQRVKREA